jgi:hypothetical protein
MSKETIPVSRVVQAIRVLRGEKVLLDSDLALLYGVETRVLNQAVKRNADRFPSDFMFQLNDEEMEQVSQFVMPLRKRSVGNALLDSSQIVMSSRKHRGKRYRHYAFTEQGVAMLSSVLNNQRAVRVNIAIMRAFVKLRQIIDTNRELAHKFSELERRVGKHDDEIAAILEAIRQLMAPPEKLRREIGFHVREKAAGYRVRRRA